MKRRYLKDFNFKENCQVLDVGCGPGDITRHGLLPLLPKSTKKLMGVDISSDMIDFAKQFHQDDDRISFERLDIGTSSIPSHLLQSFDHVFSFYCLHFAPDLRKAISNIHKMLKPKGDMFVNVISYQYLFDIYEQLLNTQKWHPYVHDYKSRMSPFQNGKNYKHDFENVLGDLGFIISHCIEERKVFPTSRDNFEGLMKAINYVDVPKHLEDEFASEQCNVMRSTDKVFIDEYGEEQYHWQYTLLTAHAFKR
ncbi:juvenile hormone acid O-methyltransferase-like isoform X2 [Photinus pyralis]|nr:juvenile hormone acid O-methyltransferase-like isoform X2 [Photinus pyralis]